MSTIIFDFDGTLADSFELVAIVVHELTGAPLRSPEELAVLRKLPLVKAVRKMGVSWWMIPHIWLTFRRRMYGRMHSVKLFPGIPKLIKELHEAGHDLLVLSSNREANVQACLEAHEIEGYFSGIYHGHVLNKALALRRIVRHRREVLAQVYYVGNETFDVFAAHSVGLKAIAVAWSGQDYRQLRRSKPEHLVEHPHEIAALFAAGKKV